MLQECMHDIFGEGGGGGLFLSPFQNLNSIIYAVFFLSDLLVTDKKEGKGE